MMKWSEFEKAHDFENLIFDLTQRSIVLAMAADLPHKHFAAFAFSCSSYCGDISLSFGVDPGYEDKRRRHRMYPPDWEYEVMEGEVEAIGALHLPRRGRARPSGIAVARGPPRGAALPDGGGAQRRDLGWPERPQDPSLLGSGL